MSTETNETAGPPAAGSKALEGIDGATGELLDRLCATIRGCHDYNGGHHDEISHDAFHHGIDTCINVVYSFVKSERTKQYNSQLDAVQRIGRAAIAKAEAVTP